MIYTVDRHVFFDKVEEAPQDRQKAQAKSDSQLPRYHPFFPVRNSAPAPCVFPISYPYTIKITEPWQLLIADSFSYSRYGASWDDIGRYKTAEGKRINQAFEHALSTGLAFANGDAGFGGSTPKTNVLSGEVGQEWPRYDKIRICGGDSFTGVIDGTDFILDAFDWENPEAFPDFDDFRMFEATQIYAGGAVRVFPGLDAYPQFLPLIRRNGEPIRYPLDFMSLYYGPRRSPYYTPTFWERVLNIAMWMITPPPPIGE